MRPPGELGAQRERLFAVHWRLTDWRVNPKHMNLGEFARTAWFGPLDLTSLRLLDNDLAIGDAPLSRASAEHIRSATSAAMERHLAANWLTAGSDVYSETDVST